ncbi:hypothetical protein SERLA73DRAFT_132863 [Serpula lacrymans var. lacrymans S7.3]|uniref:Uncharacterized protein n=2 Tax=Serpula lacrymans var. lacrymans TaxID=341189 RepID=F8PPM4_SERL3|nr:uncharacterized protein SERLADRAFT_383076 [Serpula lacrymans var. lacrymans S7.9]EGO02082.1 hypothetical protein SERLA73DRAFT_132863 [Serpula lacrymans var. lacrymans S7.3]EGO27708.1 hypothetical protein SERLADRAFT_383076 [Serpula lacrymans var. lacrymans S7.9]
MSQTWKNLGVNVPFAVNLIPAVRKLVGLTEQKGLSRTGSAEAFHPHDKEDCLEERSC